VSGDPPGKRDATEYFTQVGTGNYNEKTARMYTDLSLMTADPDIGLEAAMVFQALARGRRWRPPGSCWWRRGACKTGCGAD
jgi:hypothetical protein